MHVKDPVRLHLVIAFHQTLSTHHETLEEALSICYAPLVAHIEREQNLRVSLHFGGHILDFLARFHEAFLFRIKALVKRGQVEILGGPFYGANLALLPEADLRGQIQMAAEFWESHSGHAPSVMWPSELLWTHETPALLEDTDLRAAFIGKTQLHLRDTERAPSLGSLLRGGHQISAFVLDDALSAAVPAQPLESFLSDVAASGRRAQHQLVNLWIRAESLGLEPGTHRICFEEQYVARLFRALASGGIFETSLPSESLSCLRPALPLSLGQVMGVQLPEGEGMDAFVDATEFVHRMPEVAQIYHRMLQMSARLRLFIAEMEDAHKERELSNRLATAQRLIFSAQSHDVYWRGLCSGFGDPSLRDAVYGRLEEAEGILDALEGETRPNAGEAFIRVSHDNFEGDLSPKTYLTTARMGILIDGRRGGELRWLHDRSRGLSLLDVPSRRAEPYFDVMARARSLGAVDRLPLRRGAQPVRQSADLPNQVDALVRRGTRTWLTEADVSAGAIVSGRVANLIPEDMGWATAHDNAQAHAPTTHLFEAFGKASLMGQKTREVSLRRRIRVDALAETLSVTTHISVTASDPLVWALEIPLRLGTAALSVFVDGAEASPGVILKKEGSQITIKNEAGDSLHLGIISEGSETVLYWEPIRVSVRDLGQFRAVEGGLVLLPHLSVESTAQTTISFTCVS